MLKALKVRNQKLKGDQSGFTIVELIIVIAIAALILTIALAVVPALRRSGRNSARNSDIRAISAQVLEYSAQNGGKVPASQADFRAAVVDNVDLTHADWTSANMHYAEKAPVLKNLTFEKVGSGNLALTGGPATPTIPAASKKMDADDVLFIKGQKCENDSIVAAAAVGTATDTDIGAVIENGPETAIVVLYILEGDETDGRPTLSCLEI